jgi:hypothetical protein
LRGTTSASRANRRPKDAGAMLSPKMKPASDAPGCGKMRIQSRRGSGDAATERRKRSDALVWRASCCGCCVRAPGDLQDHRRASFIRPAHLLVNAKTAGSMRFSHLRKAHLRFHTARPFAAVSASGRFNTSLWVANSQSSRNRGLEQSAAMLPPSVAIK